MKNDEKMMKIFAVIAILFAAGDCDLWENRLYRKLMEDYIKDVRPTPSYFLATNVTFGYALHQIIDVDERDQILTTSVWLNLNWLDINLAWNSSEFDGLNVIHIPHDKVWRPDVLLVNNADPEYKDVMVSTDVYVTNKGNVTWLVFAIFRSSCAINVQYYPFDDQICAMTFSSWTYDGYEIDLSLTTEIGDVSNFMENSEFELLSLKPSKEIKFYSCCPNQPWPVIHITIHIRRRPLYYVFNQILPCLLISSMALLGFYIPADTGEKVTMCITTMLSMGVFLKTVNESMPPTSEAVPLIAMYYGVSLAIVCLATLVNVFTLKLHHKGSGKDPRPVPEWLRKFALGFLAKILCMRLEPPEEILGVNRAKQWRKASAAYARGLSLVEILKEHRRSLTIGGIVGLAVPSYSPEEETPSVHTMGKLLKPSPHQMPPELMAIKKNFEDRFCRLLNRVYATLEHNEARLTTQKHREVIREEWRHLAIVVDRLLLWLFLFATSITAIIILFQPTLDRLFR